MKVNIIKEWVKEKGNLHFSLIDPDKQSAFQAVKLAKTCFSFGTDAIMIGGSTVGFPNTEKITKAIKENVNIPLIFFPGSAEGINRFADHIFFMSLLNSKERKYLIEEQLKGAPLVKNFELHPISMGYILIKTSEKKTTVEKVSERLDVIYNNDIQKAVNYALTAQYLGMDCVYLEAGSGAERTVSNNIIRRVRKNIDIPIIVGGGIRDGKTAKEKTSAGADIIVTGTILEDNPQKLEEIISSIKS